MSQLYDTLRAATEDDVVLVVSSFHRDGLFRLTTLPADLLEFFNRMVDELTGERATAEAFELVRTWCDPLLIDRTDQKWGAADGPRLF